MLRILRSTYNQVATQEQEQQQQGGDGTIMSSNQNNETATAAAATTLSSPDPVTTATKAEVVVEEDETFVIHSATPVATVVTDQEEEGGEMVEPTVAAAKSATTDRPIVIHCSATRWTLFVLVLLVLVATALIVPLALLKGHSGEDNFELPYNPPFNENDKEDQVPLLSEQVLDGYATPEEFEADLTKVAKSYINGVVGQQLGVDAYSSFGLTGIAAIDIMAESAPTLTMSATPRSAAPPPTQKESVGNDVNDFETNNQEDGVHEGDQVVTDGKIAVASYGSSLVCWNVTDGKLLLELSLTDQESKEEAQYIRIHTLLLQDNQLVVVVGGVRLHSRIETSRILNSYRETRLLVYEIQTFEDKPGVQLRLLESKDIHGSYQSIRSIGTSVHVVTSSTLDYFFFLFEPMVRYRPTFEGLDDAAYTNRVREVATQEVIPTFVKLLSQELSECNELPRMVRLNRWATEATPKAASGLEHYLYNMGFAQSLMSIYSFDLQDVQLGQGKALQCLRSTATFFPAAPWSTKVYAANDTLVVATEGYDYQAPQKRYVRSTFLVAYDLNEAVSTPKALGNVQGNVMGQYSFRVQDSVLQVATTIQEQWTWWRREPAWLLRGRRQLQQRQDVVFTVPKTENWVITMDLQGKKGRMQEMDRLKLGKEGEVFTTVRFYKDKAYAVTFLRMDPFYILDTSDPYNLVIAGELDNITGWSSYLEPMNDDKSVMLAIGQEADERGRVLGMSISVFDARDLDNVRISARFLIETSSNIWSDSEGLRNKNAIRFNPETGRLILPLRVSDYSSDRYFRGFRVFIVKVDSIVEDVPCMVDLSDLNNKPFSSALESLEPRAMIIQGSFMTTMGSHVVMKDLDTCVTDWQLKLGE